MGYKKVKLCSSIWTGLLLLNRWLTWQVGNGYQVSVGIDLILGTSHSGILSPSLLQTLQHLGINYLYQVPNVFVVQHEINSWIPAHELHLSGSVAIEWNLYISGLSHAGIYLNEDLDQIYWSFGSGEGTVSTKLAYEAIATEIPCDQICWWYNLLWKWNIPVKVMVFWLLALNNGINTGERYRRHGNMGSTVFSLCFMADETVDHLFSQCTVTLQLGAFGVCAIRYYLTICLRWGCCIHPRFYERFSKEKTSLYIDS